MRLLAGPTGLGLISHPYDRLSSRSVPVSKLRYRPPARGARLRPLVWRKCRVPAECFPFGLHTCEPAKRSFNQSVALEFRALCTDGNVVHLNGGYCLRRIASSPEVFPLRCRMPTDQTGRFGNKKPRKPYATRGFRTSTDLLGCSVGEAEEDRTPDHYSGVLAMLTRL